MHDRCIKPYFFIKINISIPLQYGAQYKLHGIPKPTLIVYDSLFIIYSSDNESKWTEW